RAEFTARFPQLAHAERARRDHHAVPEEPRPHRQGALHADRPAAQADRRGGLADPRGGAGIGSSAKEYWEGPTDEAPPFRRPGAAARFARDSAARARPGSIPEPPDHAGGADQPGDGD